jgi:hypothetical protein
MLIYRAVPLRLFRSRYGMCCLVFGSRYCLAMPKSTTCTTAADRSDVPLANDWAEPTVRRLRASPADQEIVRLDVAIDEITLMDRLHTGELVPSSVSVFRTSDTGATDHLSRSHAHRLDAELATAHVEQVLEARPEQVNHLRCVTLRHPAAPAGSTHEDVVQALLAEVVYLGDSGCTRRVRTRVSDRHTHEHARQLARIR